MTSRAVGLRYVVVGPVPTLVADVLGARPVSQVGEVAVQRIAIEVSHLLPGWPGADEGRCDDAMYLAGLLATAAD
jgi:hypothetical protein